MLIMNWQWIELHWFEHTILASIVRNSPMQIRVNCTIFITTCLWGREAIFPCFIFPFATRFQKKRFNFYPSFVLLLLFRCCSPHTAEFIDTSWRRLRLFAAAAGTTTTTVAPQRSQHSAKHHHHHNHSSFFLSLFLHSGNNTALTRVSLCVCVRVCLYFCKRAKTETKTHKRRLCCKRRCALFSSTNNSHHRSHRRLAVVVVSFLSHIYARS